MLACVCFPTRASLDPLTAVHGCHSCMTLPPRPPVGPPCSPSWRPSSNALHRHRQLLSSSAFLLYRQLCTRPAVSPAIPFRHTASPRHCHPGCTFLPAVPSSSSTSHGRAGHRCFKRPAPPSPLPPVAHFCGPPARCVYAWFCPIPRLAPWCPAAPPHQASSTLQALGTLQPWKSTAQPTFPDILPIMNDAQQDPATYLHIHQGQK